MSFSFQKGVKYDFIHDLSSETLVFERDGKKYHRELYTCNGYNATAYFLIDDDTGQVKMLESVDMGPTRFFPLYVPLTYSLNTKPIKISLMQKIKTKSNYPTYVVDFAY